MTDTEAGEHRGTVAAVRSFAPIEGRRARVLILGTMPGVASLEAARYYAHPRNAFWPIVTTLLGEPPEAPLPPYRTRLARLRRAGIALWDVLAECERPGSLDGAIRRPSERPNDVVGLCARHPELRAIAFNGQTAARLYARHVAPLAAVDEDIALLTLPSTSPAYAALPLAEKRSRWHAALGPLLDPG